MPYPPPRARNPLTLALAAALLTACATTGPHGVGQDPRDPFEGFNRRMYQFNEGLDRAVLRPVATGYQKIVPSPARTGVGNFFGNLGDAWSFVNNGLQLKGEAAMSSFFRVAVNSTFGLGGLLDVASEMRLQRYKSDFGLTLGHWGVPTGPYVVLPLLGASSVRDTAALPVDIYGHPLAQLKPAAHRYGLRALDIVDTRARLLRASDTLGDAALDPYLMVRDFYFSRRGQAAGSDGRIDAEASDGYIPEEDYGDTPAPAAQ
ncbi:MlaA family lipoprotein [Vandammella animalimorsus]|uniref:ABC transporter n=1 Tax=Vandammella animalimorsus TaxID=2029117 RepID=A0A2A2A7K0_9BURK|nr:VacJ family lipoprotein [Vandammella animalimorsus]PAT33559.1 ABC transporter [Vandammella animalimorsus]